MRQKSNGKQQFVIKRAAGFLLLIFVFTGIIGICVEKKDNRIRADSGMETERMAEENTKAASGKIKEEEVKKVALTFDDGPSDITPEVLDILQENEIKATFFIVDYSEEDKSKIQRIIDEGHTLGLHGLSHDYAKIYSSVDAITENFIGLQKKILNDFDYNAIYIRFPGGASNTISKKYCDGVMTAATSKVEQEGFTYYDWNVDVNDAGSARTANKVYDNFVAGIVPQRENVVLMHDGYGHQPTADALQKIIDYAKENGYVFSEITEDTIPVQHGVNN